ncbi:uncharacterized protein KY384_008188 [Bacidia gigantensis]|uniref:uncharacterized protein n=1 Tax=Bacidia gigantensis TaxID=2732470 RepID=UPI001D03913F|nr:uncharacterized protein KY384_008188 [Bacidia gigantensis]KAG8526759.1 hypothetical protein KY384_008188 [Bacidia gigantensis]
MKDRLPDRLLWREFGNSSRHSINRGIYGDKTWVNDLDIVNELGGHSGCVNALSWSTSGRLLASGSDDQHLNIHSYQPDSSNAPFALATTVATGHGANIFSVKFMPHSNDRTLVTAAGDAEVRVFDIEYNGRNTGSSEGSSLASTARGQRFQNMYKGVKYLSDGNTNARVYRSHADRVKRIVTESSPHLFLTCSEDGEVRQFDLRMPSAAYPPPRGGRGFLAHREDHDDSNVPPPLISYKRYNLDLNTISCSASQPHYIALGGAHLHCFIHDRRMLGRDIGAEKGTPTRSSPASSMSAEEEELMGRATQCVRRLAREGQSQVGRRDDRHITACKISDANPNELIASWSGDHIYSFDIVQPGHESMLRTESKKTMSDRNAARKSKNGSKQKRKKAASSTSLETERKRSKTRPGPSADEDSELAIEARYENGEVEDVVMSDIGPRPSPSELERARGAVFTESQKRSLQIAKSSVKIRKMMFSLEASVHSANGSHDFAAHRASFTSALGFAASCLPEMKQIAGSWKYPMDPMDEDVVLQQTLRGNRNSSQRFVQAAGTLARCLGAKLQAASNLPHPALLFFQDISPVQPDGPPLMRREIFSYTFLKAILLWLEGGSKALLQGFKKPPDQRKNASSFPLPDEADESSIHDLLIPSLLQKAGDTPIPDVDASRFERDETRRLFESEIAAVIAFGNAIKIPLRDLSKADIPAARSGLHGSLPEAQDQKTALRYWGFKVGRGLLMKAGEGANFQFVDIAFGGLGMAKIDEDKAQEDIDPDEEEPLIQEASLVRRPRGGKSDGPPAERHTKDADPTPEADIMHESLEHTQEMNSDAETYRRNVEGNTSDEDTDDTDDNDDEPSESEQPSLFQYPLGRSRQRARVEEHVPCHSPTRRYRGHCNVKTVKDANFFGLQDEYVVSGSDGGHLFIWDKKTSELLNILEGDGEVVNVIQGHPHEPLLAVSGIDHTIKIFSPDARSQEDAKNGVSISSSTHGSQGHSSLSGRRRQRSTTNNDEPQLGDGLTSRKKMHESYQIVSQNDVQRQGGNRDAYITVGPFPALRPMAVSFEEWLSFFDG